MAQAPDSMSYQIVVRNNGNTLVTAQTVGMQISILQGSSTGSAVYEETQTPTTNINGLASVFVGSGSLISGDFSVIDWGNGPYFIKTEIDTLGGTNYTLSETNELKSVPYALHSSTTTNISTPLNESDPVYSIALSSGILASDTADWNNHTVDTNTQLDSIDIANMGYIPVQTYQIGDFAHGGIVFWVDETGQHGLVCTKVDQSVGIQWYNGVNTNTEANGNAVRTGERNTFLIVNSQGNSVGSYAAGLTSNYSVTENGTMYGDWYLPSQFELNLMYLNKTVIGATAIANGGVALANANYWSSTEDGLTNAFGQSFSSGSQYTTDKFFGIYVRSIRSF